ncbi:MAG: hypothetical protein IPG07_21115 [Crocinitomicaceae bacterium]|jgi:hypothetical protein|nr:hypothetical protein [Crocinitomicaceae bacterium]
MKNFLVLLTSFLSFQLSYGQITESDTSKSEQLYVVTKNDGTEYIGKILSDDGREILIETELLGKIYIPKSEIRSITKIEDRKEIIHGEYQSTGPFTTRYAFTTNALPIVKGENYALINLYGPEVHFAITDHLNIGIMSTWIASPMVLALKYSIKTKHEKINFSLGTLNGTSGYLNTFRGFGGLHFANISIGSRKQNITLSAGYGYVQTGSEISEFLPQTVYSSEPYLSYNSTNSINTTAPIIHGPLFSIAGITAVGAKASFVFDSMFGLFTSDRMETSTTTITEPYYNPNPPYDSTPGYYMHQVTEVNTQSIAMFLMPGMRFQTKENSAFQVSLAGVAIFRLKGFADTQKTNSFPIPMCTWFFRF